jgi:transposase InsO family protein
VATDYFTKWVEAKSYRSISSAQVIKFFEGNIIHRFGIPETITADNGPVFASAETLEFTERMGIKLVHSTPYYP